VAIVNSNGDQITSFGSGHIRNVATKTINGFVSDTDVDCTNCATVIANFESTNLNATIQAKYSVDGSTFDAVYLTDVSSPLLLDGVVQQITLTGAAVSKNYVIPIPPGAVTVRFIVTAFTAGSAVLTAVATTEDHNTLAMLVKRDATNGFTGMPVVGRGTSNLPIAPPTLHGALAPGGDARVIVGLEIDEPVNPVALGEPFADTLAMLKKEPLFNGRAAAMGFCYGGPYAILGPKRLGYAAGISCHGSQMLDYIHELDGVGAPVCIIWGDQDHRAPAEVLNAYRAVPSGMKNVEVHIFPGVLHGYMMPGSPKAFDQVARDFSMARALAILDGLRRVGGKQSLRQAS
jgi:hypothetical protein